MKIERHICGSLEANGYIVYLADGGQAWIIDPGYDAGFYRKFAIDHGLSVGYILLTHTHSDHSGKADELAKHFGCPVCAHREELDFFKGSVDLIFDGGEVLTLDGKENVDILHTPGHTAGGLCFFSKKSRVAFTGDTIFNVDLGYTHFPGGSEKRMRKSLREVVNLWDNGVTIYPGHGDPATMKQVREINSEFLEMIR